MGGSSFYSEVAGWRPVNLLKINFFTSILQRVC